MNNSISNQAVSIHSTIAAFSAHFDAFSAAMLRNRAFVAATGELCDQFIQCAWSQYLTKIERLVTEHAEFAVHDREAYAYASGVNYSRSLVRSIERFEKSIERFEREEEQARQNKEAQAIAARIEQEKNNLAMAEIISCMRVLRMLTSNKRAIKNFYSWVCGTAAPKNETHKARNTRHAHISRMRKLIFPYLSNNAKRFVCKLRNRPVKCRSTE
jgi:uncharacterized protein (UPF0335 family)